MIARPLTAGTVSLTGPASDSWGDPFALFDEPPPSTHGRTYRAEDEPVCCGRCGHWRKFHGNKGYGGPLDGCDAREDGPDGAPDEGPACDCPAFVPPPREPARTGRRGVARCTRCRTEMIAGPGCELPPMCSGCEHDSHVRAAK